MTGKLAVALSIYKTDKPEYVSESIGSILSQPTDLTLFIQVDGKVSDELIKKITEYEVFSNVIIEFFDKNKGLAFQLNRIIDKAVNSNEFKYLARMDADDICMERRFEKQINFLNITPSVSVVGSDVLEISELGKELFYKKMEPSHDKILKNIIKKCPFNHPSVMLRMSIFEEGFRYKAQLKNTQDYYLWVDLIAAGKRFANINEPLLKFRVNDTFHSRRGFSKALNDLNSRLYAFKMLDVLTFSNALHTLNLFLLRLAPESIKKWAYRNLRNRGI